MQDLLRLNQRQPQLGDLAEATEWPDIEYIDAPCPGICQVNGFRNELTLMRHCCMDRRVGCKQPRPNLNSCDADGGRASKLQHPVQDPDSDDHLGRPTAVLARAYPPSRARSPVADHPLVAPDVGLDPAALVVA
jgi:hypothetical protein